MRRTPMKRSRPRAMSQAEREAKTRFRSEVMGLQRECWIPLCRNRAVDPHHIIPKSFLKAHTSAMDETRWQIVHDPRNGVPICTACHANITSRFRPLLRSEVPQAAENFAHDHGLTWKLERECPEDGDFFFRQAS